MVYLKVDAAAFARFALVDEVEEGALRAVEDEPALVPRLEAGAHLVQVAASRSRRQGHVRAQLHLMAGRFDVLAQIESLAQSDGQVASQRPLLLLKLVSMTKQ